jgi:serine/threonine protein kinase
MPNISGERWQPPQHFRNYVLEQEIDGGGMGIVYKARTISEQRVVAIKFLLDKHNIEDFLEKWMQGNV